MNSENMPSSDDYDSDRLADDPEYRDQVLNEIASESRDQFNSRMFQFLINTAMGIFLFVAGIFLGSRLGINYSYWIALFTLCLIVAPIVGYAIILKQRG